MQARHNCIVLHSGSSTGQVFSVLLDRKSAVYARVVDGGRKGMVILVHTLLVSSVK